MSERDKEQEQEQEQEKEGGEREGGREEGMERDSTLSNQKQFFLNKTFFPRSQPAKLNPQPKP